MSGVSFMEKLLDGVAVEWKSLDNVGEFLRGKRFVKADMMSEGVPCIHYGEMYTHFGIWADKAKSFLDKAIASKLRVASPGDVIIVAAGETIEDIGNGTAWLGENDVVFHDACFSFKSKLDPKYVSYYLRTSLFKDQIKSSVSSGKISSINAKGLGKAEIPIPCPENPKKSLEIQAEIVRILDAFTAHAAELTAELTARRKQYSYYRDKLLSFEEVVPVIPLSDCCESIADGDHQAPPKTDEGIPFITISNVSDSNRIDFENTRFVAKTYYDGLADKRKARKGDILYTVVGSFGIPIFIEDNTKFAFQRHIAILRPDKDVVISKYLYHFFQCANFLKQANTVAAGAAQKTITLASLNRMKVSVPSLEEQARIVAILDKFDTLTNSISEGLPREIELRQKQYEYYRDLLLSFPRPDAEKTANHA